MARGRILKKTQSRSYVILLIIYRSKVWKRYSKKNHPIISHSRLFGDRVGQFPQFVYGLVDFLLDVILVDSPTIGNGAFPVEKHLALGGDLIPLGRRPTREFGHVRAKRSHVDLMGNEEPFC